jgi:hypothetical protein
MILARSNGKQNWIRVSKSNPCPICGKPDNCSVSVDGGAAWCGRVESPKQNQGGQWFHKLTDENRPAGYIHPSHKPKKEKPKRTDWPDIAQSLASCDRVHLEQLSTHLMIPLWAITDLGCGWGSIDDWKSHNVFGKFDAWSMPERSPDGVIVGINRRQSDHEKRNTYRSDRGLTFAADWQSKRGPTLCVEGFTCTAAALSMGLSVVGRHSCNGGGAALLELFQEHAGQIVIMGERDPNGKGEQGAKAIAKHLADGLNRTVYWSPPPESAQDTRGWLNTRDPLGHKRSRGELDRLGERFIDGLELNPVRPDRPTVERFEPQGGELVELSDWRTEMVSARAESLDKPGLYFDRSPTGSGKSFAATESMRQADRSLYVQPTHANCIEEESKLQAAGLDAKAIPEMNENSCRNWDEARNALQSGISAGAAVCPGCPFRNSCEYLADSKTAQAASVTICTHARAEKQLTTLSENRDLIIVEEDPTNLIRPTTSVDPRSLNQVATVFQEAKANAAQFANDELWHFIDQAEGLSEMLLDGCRTAKQTRAVTLPAPIGEPKHLEKHLWRAMKLVVADGTDNLNSPVDPEAVKLITGILTGRIDRLVIQLDEPHKQGGERWKIATLVGSSRTALPHGLPIWFQDATGSPKQIGDLCGQAVIDRTPRGYLANVQAIKQVPRDITSRTDPAMVAATLEGWMKANQNPKRVGIICWKNHRSAIFSKRSELLTESTRSRVHLVTHFGSGTDRASNQWLDCDALIILGTYRPNQTADKAKLIQLGKITAAADSNQGGWGLRRWEGRTASGELIQVDGMGYSDPDWRTAREHLCQAALLQAIGRGRGILADGIPSWIFSSEPLGPTVELVNPDEMRPLKRAILEASEAVSHYFQTPIDTNIGKWKYPEPVQTKHIADRLGVSSSCASKRLQAAQDAGLVARSDTHKGGWIPTEPAPDIPPTDKPTDKPTEKPSRRKEVEHAPPSGQTISHRPVVPLWDRSAATARQLAESIPGVDVATNIPPPEH